MQGSEDLTLAQIEIIGGREKETVGCSVALKQGRIKRDGFEREGNGGQGKIVNGFVEVVNGAKGVREVLGADSRRLLTFHRWHKHAVVVNEGERSIRTHHDIVRLDVAMGKRLRSKPSSHLAETVAEHRHFIAVCIVFGNVRLHRFALNPVHQQHGELVVFTIAVNKQFLLQVFHGSNIRRIDKFQFLCYLAVCLRASFLILGETFQGVALPSLLVLHLEHDGKRTAATIRLAMFFQHGH